MKIVREAGFDPALREMVRKSILAADEIVHRAKLDTPEIREYLDGVQIVPSNRMVRAAGRARFRKKRIALNVRLLAKYPGQILPVLIHETAHLIDAKLGDGVSYHGPGWKQIILQLGFEPERYHTMDTQSLQASRGQ